MIISAVTPYGLTLTNTVVNLSKSTVTQLTIQQYFTIHCQYCFVGLGLGQKGRYSNKCSSGFHKFTKITTLIADIFRSHHQNLQCQHDQYTCDQSDNCDRRKKVRHDIHTLDWHVRCQRWNNWLSQSGSRCAKQQTTWAVAALTTEISVLEVIR